MVKYINKSKSPENPGRGREPSMDQNQSTEIYSIKLKEIADEFKLETLCVPENWENAEVFSVDISRPGLALNGFYDCFDKKRIQLIGHAEHQFLSSLTSDDRKKRLAELAEHDPPAVVLTSSLPAFDEMLDVCREYALPLFRTDSLSSRFQAAVIGFLSMALAPRIQRHGVFVEVYGEGILILGDSGIGKSETAIELVKRGHRLIADDAVIIKRASEKTLVGTSPEVIRHFVELRGIGIVDIRRIFGIGAIKESEKINLIIKLEHWDQNKIYDRIGSETETTNILGLEIPTYTIPVHPGRNLAIIIEIAAMESRQKRMGYNTAQEFNKRLMEHLQSSSGSDLK